MHGGKPHPVVRGIAGCAELQHGRIHAHPADRAGDQGERQRQVVDAEPVGAQHAGQRHVEAEPQAGSRDADHKHGAAPKYQLPPG